MPWEAIAAVSTAFYAFTFLIALVVAGWQLHEMSKARKLESVLHILEYVDDSELRHVRWFIYENADTVKDLFGISKDGPHSWERRKQMDREIRRLSSLDGGKEIDIHQFDSVLSALNNVAFLVRIGQQDVRTARNVKTS